MATGQSFDIVVVGAGPAGLAAAIEAAKRGARTLVVDENNKPGGQLFKQIHKFFGSHEHRAGVRGYDIGRQLLDEAANSGVTVWLDTVVHGLFDSRVAVLREGRHVTVETGRIILATGASENAVAFPGSTLPGVMGAGAIQTMINVHRVLPGKRFVMLGSGNVGLIVCYQLMQAGAEVLAVVEAMPSIGGYGVHAAKIRRAGVPILVGTTISRVVGQGKVEAVVLATLVGIPMYADIFGTIPVAEALYAKGAQLGAILAFMMGVTTLSLPSMIMLRKAVKPKLLAVFIGICTAGIIIVGYLFNAFQFLF